MEDLVRVFLAREGIGLILECLALRRRVLGAGSEKTEALFALSEVLKSACEPAPPAPEKEGGYISESKFG